MEKIVKAKVVSIKYQASCDCGHTDCNHSSTFDGVALVTRKNKKPTEAYFQTPNPEFPGQENARDTTPKIGSRVRIEGKNII